MAKLFQINLPDMKYSRVHSFNINGNEYKMIFTFNDEIYQILQDLETSNRMRAKADPLMTFDGVREYNNKYTYIEYYSSIPDDVSSWLSEQSMLPASILNLSSTDERIQELELRRAVAKELDKIRTQYKVMCRWQFTMMSNGDIISDGFIEKGSWFMPYEDMSVKFEYDMDYIDFDDVQNVTMLIRIN